MKSLPIPRRPRVPAYAALLLAALGALGVIADAYLRGHSAAPSAAGAPHHDINTQAQLRLATDATTPIRTDSRRAQTYEQP